MRRSSSLLFLALAAAAWPLRAQDELIRFAPLVPGPVPVSPGNVARTIASARSAQETGLPALAAFFFREAVAQAQAPAERRSLTLALTTALLDNGEVDEAEKALNSLLPPHDSAWNLRAGLVAVQQRRLPDAGGHLAEIRREDLAVEDVGWWFFLQGRIADAAGEAARAQEFYDQAESAAVSRVQRTRFQLSREQVYARSAATVTAADVDRARQNAVAQRGTVLGPEFNLIYAVNLGRLGRSDQAINVLQAQLTALAPSQQAERDRTLLFLGLIATPRVESGRTALLQLLAEGARPDLQRQALLLLANEPQATEFRPRLDALIDRPVPHPILEDLLMKRAQLAAAERTPNGYIRAQADIERLLREFPGSVLKAPALALSAAIEWEQKRYIRAASLAAEARGAATDPAARARLGLMEAEALFRVPEYRRAANAYDAVLRDRPADVPAGDLLFQRLQAEIEATDFSVPAEAARPALLLDQLAGDPAFDVVNRWQAEWNLARKLRAVNQADAAMRRVNALLASPPAAVATLPADLRARMAWLQARLSLEADQPETTVRLVTALGGALTNVTPALAAEIRSSIVLLQARAEIALGREKEALETFDRLRREFRASDAAASSILIQAAYLESKDRLPEAQALLRRMPDDFPNSPYVPQALYNAALLDERRGEKLEAANRLDQLARAHPNSPLVFEARLKQADLLRELTQFPAARLTYERLTINYPTNPRVYEAEMGLADCDNAQATADPTAAERAAERYERLRDLAGVPIDLRVAAGYKLGLVHQLRGRAERAMQVWWGDVVTPFLQDEREAARLGGPGRTWMGRTLIYLGQLYLDQNRRDEARTIWQLIIDKDLPYRSEAERQLAILAVGP